MGLRANVFCRQQSCCSGAGSQARWRYMTGVNDHVQPRRDNSPAPGATPGAALPYRNKPTGEKHQEVSYVG